MSRSYHRDQHRFYRDLEMIWFITQPQFIIHGATFGEGISHQWYKCEFSCHNITYLSTFYCGETNCLLLETRSIPPNQYMILRLTRFLSLWILVKKNKNHLQIKPQKRYQMDFC